MISEPFIVVHLKSFLTVAQYKQVGNNTNASCVTSSGHSLLTKRQIKLIKIGALSLVFSEHLA